MMGNGTGFNYKGDHFRGVNAHWLNKIEWAIHTMMMMIGQWL